MANIAISAEMRCARCGEQKQCFTWDSVRVCLACLRLIVREWQIQREDFAELTRS